MRVDTVSSDLPDSFSATEFQGTLPRRLIGALPGLFGPEATLRAWMLLALFTFVALFGIATWSGYSTVERLTAGVAEELGQVRRSATFTRDLETTLRQQIEAGLVHAADGAAESLERYERLTDRADAQIQAYISTSMLGAAETTLLATIESLGDELAAGFQSAHRLRQEGRTSEAMARSRAIEADAANLFAELQALTALTTERLAQSAADLERRGERGQRWLLIVFVLTSILSAALVLSTMAIIHRPLLKLRAAANRMGKGDLRVQVEGGRFREFRLLADTFNSMATRLRDFVGETTLISDHIAISAHELSTISEQVAASSGDVAAAMSAITQGAHGQSEGITITSEALDEMRVRGEKIDDAVDRVVRLSEEIKNLAERHREELGGAVRSVLEVREVVERSELEARALAAASVRIDRFVEMISSVARQTNLLALNAAIEAARAGENGRGFAVVAEEVRKLADGSSEAADEVSGIVQEVGEKIQRMVETMEGAARQVEGVESAARSAEIALEQIMGTVEGVTHATAGVDEALVSNREALGQVESALSQVAGAAQSHAASAQQVFAAAEEQSAATEQVSMASSQLRSAASRMKKLVSGLKA